MAAVLAVAIAGGAVWFLRRETPAPPAAAPVTVDTAAVVRTDLSATVSLTGTLGYGRPEPVKGGKDGIVTWLPRPGATIARGEQLYRVADRPVPLFYGSMPLYRDLAQPGTVGRDVRIIARNLEALGYEIGSQPGPGETITRPAPAPAAGKPKPKPRQITVRTGEGVLTSSLMKAVKRWQQDTELPVTGHIAVGDVSVLPGAVRVATVTALLGDGADTPLLTVTPTAKVVTALAAVAEAGTIHRGDRVTVVLPGDKSVAGKVAAVATAVQQDEAEGTNAEQKRAVTVTVDDPRKLDGIDAATVQVDLVGETRKDVLAVPVGALVALSEGGYAVQVAEGGALVAVETGMFAKGLVEVTGAGLAEDLQVVTTS